MSPFQAELTAAIQAGGSITVADYMARCNAHYYATRDPLGAEGDFTTAPEISQIFGELIGAWLADSWQKLGSPRALLCEAGPGRGTLMQDALRATRGVTGFHDALDVLFIETSPHLRQKQGERLQGAHPRISWGETLDQLPALPLLFIANEFFDALPVRQFVRARLEEVERRIEHDGSALCFAPEGEVTREISPASLAVMKTLARHIHRHGGAALIIDYGYEGGVHGDTLQAVHRHRFADPLLHPGEADLTAHVDFSALLAAARESGASAFGAVDQGLFLKRLGAELRATALCRLASPEQQQAILQGLERLVAPQAMGELFKVIAITSILEKPAGF